MLFDVDKNKYVMQIDSTDRLINKIPKIEAHLKGIRHKAFSVLIFNNDGKMLIQKSAKEKYHSGGLWSNACCGHQITQDLLYEAQKRLFEELGIVCKLRDLFRFHYNEVVSSSMIENETDDVLIGFVNSYDIYPNPEEIEKVKWMDFSALLDDIKINPNNYTIWFKIITNTVEKSYRKLINDMLTPIKD